MSRIAAILGTTIFFFAAPCVVAGLIPWLITGWNPNSGFPGDLLLKGLGCLLIAAGFLSIVESFVRFVVDGRELRHLLPRPKHLS